MYTITVYSCVLSPHDTVTRSSFKCHSWVILEIWSNTAITMCYFIQLGAMWRELYKQGFKCNLWQKSPCRKSPLVVTTAVIPLVDLHLSSMTKFSELGSQKVPCCDGWLQAGHWMLLNFAPDTLSYLLPQQLQRMHMHVDATMWYRSDNHCFL